MVRLLCWLLGLIQKGLKARVAMQRLQVFVGLQTVEQLLVEFDRAGQVFERLVELALPQIAAGFVLVRGRVDGVQDERTFVISQRFVILFLARPSAAAIDVSFEGIRV